MKFLSPLLIAVVALGTSAAKASPAPGDYIIKLKSHRSIAQVARVLKGAKVEALGGPWVHVQLPESAAARTDIEAVRAITQASFIQPNYKVVIPEQEMLTDVFAAEKMAAFASKNDTHGMPLFGNPPPDNPKIPTAPVKGRGLDPLFSNQWGMMDIGVREIETDAAAKDTIVAVIDTGVDYTHPDLLPNMWRNPGETGTDKNGADKSYNGIDDDKNGFIDDVVGWDFASNDNLPYDMTSTLTDVLTGAGNPGHGTHCAGNVGAATSNGMGVRGVADHVKIMAVRFLTEKGQGSTAGAVQAIHYAVDNGARVLSNSWGMEGEDPTDPAGNQALQDAINYAKDKGVLFVAAAGNGHNGVGYDNDTDPKPGMPASYNIANIVSVAAIDANDQLGSFSCWGLTSVHIAAPGVNIFSTMVNNNYDGTIVDLSILGLPKVTWDGTSMATPHVAGAAALYWSRHPEKTWSDVKSALLSNVTHIPTLAGRLASGGKLNLRTLMK